MTAALLAVLIPSIVDAQAATWQQAETKHFLFIFEPRDRASVDELLGICEEVYDNVSGFLHSYPAKVPCVIRGRRDDANGVTMSFPARIDLYLTAPNDFFLGARTESWLKALLTHELTHFVHQSMDIGVLSGLSHVFGSDFSTLSLDFLPGWAIEGPAVYDETQFTEGGRGRNPLFEMYTKAAILNGSLYSLEQAAYESAFPPPDRIYVAGYQLLDWLEGTYGPGTFQRIMDAYLAFPFFGPWSAIKTVTGKDPSLVFAEMKSALVARYTPDAAVPGGRLITPNGRVGDWTRPQPTERGLYLYHTGPEVAPAIVRWNPANNTETLLVKTTLADPSSFSATHDGGTIWFADLADDVSRPAEERTTADLYVFDLATGSTHRRTYAAHLWHPAVSADGSTLLAVQSARSYTRLVEVDERTGRLRVLFSRANGNVYTPALSPDGSRVAFVVNLRGVQDVYTADLGALRAGSQDLTDVSDPIEDVNVAIARPVLGPDPFGEYYPSFLDNQRLVFSSDRSGSLALYVANLSTGLVMLVQTDPVAAVAAAPQGSDLVYSSYGSTGLCIKSVPVDQLDAVAITATPPAGPEALVAPTDSLTVSRPYVDLPAPTLWLPTLVLAPSGAAALDVAAGPGLYAQGGSLLGASSWQIQLGWLIGENQPVTDFSVSAAMGSVTIAAATAYTYQYEGVWAGSLTDSLIFAWTPFAEETLDVTRSLQVAVGVRHTALKESSDTFSLAQSFAGTGTAWYSTIAVPATLSFSWSGPSSLLDLNPTRAFEAWTQISTYLPLLSVAQTQTVMETFAALNLPSPLAHELLKLGLKTAQTLGVSSAEYSDPYTVPRGFPLPRSRSSLGGALASIDYLVPLGLIDQPLPFSFALTAAGLGMHLEAVADFDPFLPSFAISPRLYVGIDVSLSLRFNELRFPVGLGIAAAIDTASGSSFNAATDIGIYLFSGFDSFGATARQAGEALIRP